MVVYLDNHNATLEAGNLTTELLYKSDIILVIGRLFVDILTVVVQPQALILMDKICVDKFITLYSVA